MSDLLMQVSNLACDPAEEFASHQTWLRTVIFSRLGNREEADEVLQEVALAAAQQSSRQQACNRQPVDRVAPWLYRVALRQVLLLRRKQGRRRRLMDHVATQAVVSQSSSTTIEPLDWMLSQERGQMVRMALATLCERDRQLLLLKYIDSLSYEEIGQRLGVSASSVQSRLHRARQLLRHRLCTLEVSDKVNNTE